MWVSLMIYFEDGETFSCVMTEPTTYKWHDDRHISMSDEDTLFTCTYYHYTETGPTFIITVVFDEMDSGLSVDNIDYIMNKVIDISEVRSDIQFVISFNNYAVCRKYTKIKSMMTGGTLEMNSYNQFYKFISSNHNIILSKRNRNMFTGEILGSGY